MSLNALAEPTLPNGTAATKQTDAVMERIAGVTETLAQLLSQIALSREALSRLQERQQALQLRRRAMEAMAEGSARAEARAQIAGDSAALKLQLEEITQQEESSKENLREVEAQLNDLQHSELGVAQLQDAQHEHARAQQEQEKLEGQVDDQRRELGMGQSREQQESAWRNQHDTRAARRRTTLMQPSDVALLAAQEGVSKESLAWSSSNGDSEALPLPAGAPRSVLQGLAHDVGSFAQGQQQLQAGGAPVSAARQAHTQAQVSALQGRFAGVASKAYGAGHTDVNMLVQYVMQEAYLQSSEDLKFYAHRVMFYTNLKKRIREELQQARRFLSEHTSAADPKKLDAPYARKKFSRQGRIDGSGNLQPREPEDDGEATDVRALEEYIKELDNRLNTAGEDAQLAQLELQNMTQNQARTLQTLSNLAKVFHETSMSIIRKIGS